MFIASALEILAAQLLVRSFWSHAMVRAARLRKRLPANFVP
jgi:hypothetical protein